MSKPLEKQPFEFEKALTELNELVEKMEQGNLTLEESLKSFENGINLIRHCQKALTEAEQKVKVLTQQQDVLTLEDYNLPPE